MESVICRYLDKDRNEMLIVGSEQFVKQKTMDSKQIIEQVGIVQTDEQRQHLVELDQDQLCYVLEKFMQENQIYVERPN